MWSIIVLFFITTIFTNINVLAENELKAGVYEKQMVLKDGSMLRYTLVLPNLNSNKKFPLILGLHYGGEVTPYYSRGYLEKLVIPAFKSLDTIIIAPDCPGTDWRDPKSEEAVLELLDKISKELPVDNSHVVITGYSRGGIGTWFMAAKHPELFSAAIAVSASPKDEPSAKVPFYVIHSRKDEIFELEPVEEAVKKLQNKGTKVELQIIDDISHFETVRFADPLSKTIQWLNNVWDKDRQ
ncbi:MAG: prolyl oligopeptidase family serine peptidase [Acidobacteria bacterium]|nr:prolyl oligopeptidase family serine peptidase [Acidobacteriota bacterium]